MSLILCWTALSLDVYPFLLFCGFVGFCFVVVVWSVFCLVCVVVGGDGRCGGDCRVCVVWGGGGGGEVACFVFVFACWFLLGGANVIFFFFLDPDAFCVIFWLIFIIIIFYI